MKLRCGVCINLPPHHLIFRSQRTPLYLVTTASDVSGPHYEPELLTRSANVKKLVIGCAM